jgi:quercetin dioxygenase-like cupin family protein
VYSDEDVSRLRRISFLRRVERFNAAAIRRELGLTPPPQHDHGGELNPVLGRRLRALRTSRGLSLADVASKTALSVSFLSAVERGQSGISLGNLFKLADVYGTTVPGLQQGYRRLSRRLVRPAERPRYVANHGRVLIEDLITRPGALEAQHIEIAPGGESEEAYTHPGEELIFVMSGRLSMWLDESEHYELQSGDALYFHSTQLHRWRNESDTPAVVLWVNVPLVETDERQATTRYVAQARSRHGSTVPAART